METKVLLLTHGGWGSKLVESLNMILGNVTCCDEIALLPQHTLQDYIQLVDEYTEKISKDSIIITDLYGGTTTKVATMIGLKKGLDIYCGLSAPLLLEVCSQIQFQGEVNKELLIEAGLGAFKDVVEEYKKTKGEENVNNSIN